MISDAQKQEKLEYEKLDEAVKTFVDDCKSKIENGKLVLKSLKNIKQLIGIHLVGEIEELIITDCPNFQLDGIEKLDGILTKLTVNNCNIVDLIPISDMQSLQYLDLSNNNIAKIEPLELLVPLVDLDLSNNNIDWQELLYINTLFNLKNLNLCGNPCCKYEDVIHCILYGMINPVSKKVEAEHIWYLTADKSKNDLDDMQWLVPPINNSLAPFPLEQMEQQIKKQKEKLLPYIERKEQEIKDEAARLEALEKRLADGAKEVQDGVQNVRPTEDAQDIQ